MAVQNIIPAIILTIIVLYWLCQTKWIRDVLRWCSSYASQSLGIRISWTVCDTKNKKKNDGKHDRCKRHDDKKSDTDDSTNKDSDDSDDDDDSTTSTISTDDDDKSKQKPYKQQSPNLVIKKCKKVKKIIEEKTNDCRNDKKNKDDNDGRKIKKHCKKNCDQKPPCYIIVNPDDLEAINGVRICDRDSSTTTDENYDNGYDHQRNRACNNNNKEHGSKSSCHHNKGICQRGNNNKACAGKCPRDYLCLVNQLLDRIVRILQDTAFSLQDPEPELIQSLEQLIRTLQNRPFLITLANLGYSKEQLCIIYGGMYFRLLEFIDLLRSDLFVPGFIRFPRTTIPIPNLNPAARNWQQIFLLENTFLLINQLTTIALGEALRDGTIRTAATIYREFIEYLTTIPSIQALPQSELFNLFTILTTHWEVLQDNVFFGLIPDFVAALSRQLQALRALGPNPSIEQVMAIAAPYEGSFDREFLVLLAAFGVIPQECVPVIGQGAATSHHGSNNNTSSPDGSDIGGNHEGKSTTTKKTFARGTNRKKQLPPIVYTTFWRFLQSIDWESFIFGEGDASDN